jgi:hypothetical protein
MTLEAARTNEQKISRSFTRGVFVVRIFQESGHGKGEVDSLGAIVKSFLSEQAVDSKGKYYNNLNRPLECYLACRAELRTFKWKFPSELAKQKVNKREFYLVTEQEMEEMRVGRPAFKSVPDTMKMHAVQSTGVPGVIDSKLFHCACTACYHAPSAGSYARGAAFKGC